MRIEVDTSGIPDSYYRVFLSHRDGRVIRDLGELLPHAEESLTAEALLAIVESGRFAEFLESVCAHAGFTETRISLVGLPATLLFRGFQTPHGILVAAGRDSDVAPVEDPSSIRLAEVSEPLTKVAHDLMNPLSGILAASQFLSEDAADVLSAAQLTLLASIESSARRVLDMVHEIPRLALVQGSPSPEVAGQELSRQKLESMELVVGGIAHDFNNLLGGIQVNSELALSDLPEGAPAAEAIKSISAVALRASEIVRQLMVYAGKEKATFEQVSLSGLAEEMVALLRVAISKNATLMTDLAADLPFVMANASQIRQILMNLILNASEALPVEGGVITVKTETAESGSVLLEVTDTGCGMSEDIRRRAFDPYFSTKSGGRGLGLAAVQGMVRSHGGSIYVASSPGKGTRIDVLLPSILGPRGQEASVAIVPSADTASGAILIVEDEETLRRAVSKMLRRRGFSVIEAGDGGEAVDLFREHGAEIRVVLLDVTLPGKSGQEVLKEMRSLRPDVRVILTTAFGEQYVGKEGIQHDWSYIRKPYRLGDLIERIRLASADDPRANATGLKHG